MQNPSGIMNLDNDDYSNIHFIFYEKNDFMAPFASGSAKYDTMIICPCSMGTLARIASWNFQRFNNTSC
jgi:4-hydroxy-3-polyprenylbenzoate decarboxylase